MFRTFRGILRLTRRYFITSETTTILIHLLSGLIVLLVVILLAVMFCDLKTIYQFLGLQKKTDVLKFLGIGIAGLVLMLQALIANKRAKAMEETAKAQAQANWNTEQGQRQERLKNAIEHLGNISESVRLGGAYELFHLAQDTESVGQTVMDILCAHIRRTTRDKKYQEDYPSQPSEEIQSLLTLLFVQEHEVFIGLRINLRESWLNGADLRGARLSGADLRRARLNKAFLHNACLQRVVFTESHLKGTILCEACLREAQLFMVQMQGAYLKEACLQGANIMDGLLTAAYLQGAYLQGADLSNAKMYGATLTSAKMQGAKFSWTYLQGASLDNANLQGAGDHHWDSSTPFAERIRGSIGKESDLSIVVDGGMKREPVEKLVNKLLSPEKKDVLKERLRPYIDKPHRLGMPENHRAIIGSYTEENAKQWITEHDAAMTVRNSG